MGLTHEQKAAATLAMIDQDWSEAAEWFAGSEWTGEIMGRFTTLLCCETESLRTQATEDELDCIQRLGRIAFYEVWRRHVERMREVID